MLIGGLMSIFAKDPEAVAKFATSLPVPEFGQPSLNISKPLHTSRVAIVTTAALHQEGAGFELGDSDFHFETLPRQAGNLKLGHHSVNFDRGGFAADINVVYPIDRLQELADSGILGEVANNHYSFAGNQSPSVSEIRLDSGPRCASEMRKEQVDVVLLTGT
jgi:D-proline reductase (dithiol) PrdB